MDQSSKRPKILETVDSLSKMSKIFDQIMILIDTLDQLVETEISLENLKMMLRALLYILKDLLKIIHLMK